jgi:two-component system, OmpR family, KDP operon response regulator KdpE
MNPSVKKPLLHKPEVLIVEDDPQIRMFLKAMLASEGCRVHEAVDGSDGLAQATARNPNLLLLDLGLPDKDGMVLIQEIRKWSSMPIIVISARTGERDKIEALDAGADDYVTKPFAPGEVSARVRSIFRRASVLNPADANGTIHFGNIEVRLGTRRVFVGGGEVHLTPNEYKLLEVLLRYSENVVTHRQLLKEVWGPEHLEEAQYLRVFMRQLRTKLEKDPANPRHLITEPGIGYRLLRDRESLA